ncbi:uncharacterized protein HMPREF1541_01463 [Cyphellophora europaea CBS 101466]|uniref:Uncharacterized protein n=1 Tax=Cyphellophora europaea (strain CBS 101466) TaxID=1220924 RepID=W2S2W9_CYPE1|nr:uncharacterized protein HMPREF1541_01463 [Cyphellophora europaea CBS 101466]ETN42309.1 hypothetical protein HMPREF1541_01463 [Cyphellophora europaea CBS 101466]
MDGCTAPLFKGRRIQDRGTCRGHPRCSSPEHRHASRTAICFSTRTSGFLDRPRVPGPRRQDFSQTKHAINGQALCDQSNIRWFGGHRNKRAMET